MKTIKKIELGKIIIELNRDNSMYFLIPTIIYDHNLYQDIIDKQWCLVFQFLNFGFGIFGKPKN